MQEEMKDLHQQSPCLGCTEDASEQRDCGCPEQDTKVDDVARRRRKDPVAENEDKDAKQHDEGEGLDV